MNETLEYLESIGSDKEILVNVKEEVEYSIKHYDGLDDFLFQLELDIKAETRSLLKETNQLDVPIFNAIASTIFYVDTNNQTEFNISCYGSGEKMVSEDTLFDISAITKLYTLLLAYRLEEVGFLSFDQKIKELSPLYPKLGELTIKDLVIHNDEFCTIGNIAKAKNDREARGLLKTIQTKDKDKRRKSYSDLGAIALGNILTDVTNQNLDCNYTFREVMELFLFEPTQIPTKETRFRPCHRDILGTGINHNGVSDLQTRALGGITGSAGIFSTSQGLITLSRRMFEGNEVFDWCEHLCPKSKLLAISTSQSSNGLGFLGAHIKNTGSDRTVVPNEYSDSAFAYQGINGATAIFDPEIHIHNSILVDAFPKNGAKSEFGNHLYAYDKYQRFLTKETLLAILLKKHYEQRHDESISITKKFILR